MVQQFMQKKCIQLVLLKAKQDFFKVYILTKKIVVYLSMVWRFINSKQMYEIKDGQTEICLGNISTDFSANNM